jgi:hypothetical protein
LIGLVLIDQSDPIEPGVVQACLFSHAGEDIRGLKTARWRMELGYSLHFSSQWLIFNPYSDVNVQIVACIMIS